MLATIGAALLIGTAAVSLLDTKDKKPDYTISSFLYSLSDKNKICTPAELTSLSGDGIWCSESFRLSRRQSNEHVLLIAPSGAGKSRYFVIPNCNALMNCSLVVTDPCGEIERNCKTDKKVYVLNPFSSGSIGYDPLKNCRSEFEVRKMAKTILMNGSQTSRSGNVTQQQDWIEMATPLLTAYFLYCYHSKKYNFAEVIENICTMSILPHMSKEAFDKNPEIAKTIPCIKNEIMNDKFESPKIELEAFLQVVGAQPTLSSIRTVLNTCLQVFLDDRVREIFSKPNLDFRNLRREESILFIQIPERHAEYFAPLSATFMTQLIDSLLDNKGLQTYMLLDEFTNIGVLPNMTKLLSTARKHDLSIVAAIQSLTQLTRVYGEIEGKELQELFKCILATCGIKDNSADYISALLGTAETKVGQSWVTKPLMESNEIRRMRKKEILIICNNKRPVKDYMLDAVS